MSITAKVFISECSQAIRLPAKLCLQSKEVQFEKIGDTLWLMPQTGVEQDMGLSVFIWFETVGLISYRRDWFIGFKV